METDTIELNVAKTSISPEVLHEIARLTTLSVQGVCRMAGSRGKLDKLFGKDSHQGVKVQVKDRTVFVDIYVVLMSNLNVREVSREIQANVARAISEIVGMDVGGVNIHIMDIDFSV